MWHKDNKNNCKKQIFKHYLIKKHSFFVQSVVFCYLYSAKCVISPISAIGQSEYCHIRIRCTKIQHFQISLSLCVHFRSNASLIPLLEAVGVEVHCAHLLLPLASPCSSSALFTASIISNNDHQRVLSLWHESITRSLISEFFDRIVFPNRNPSLSYTICPILVRTFRYNHSD